MLQFRLNSIYDPDYSTGTGQLKATPWNEVNPLYQQYQVISVTIHITSHLNASEQNSILVIKAQNGAYASAPSVNDAVAFGPLYKDTILSSGT